MFELVEDHAMKPHDHERIGKQRKAVFDLMKDGEWRRLKDIATALGYPEASVSARLRDFRKPAYGGYAVERRRWFPESGTWAYRLVTGEGEK